MDAQDADVAHLFERLAVPVASYRVFDKSKTASLEGDWPLLRAIEKASQAPASASPSLPFRTDMRTIPAAPSVVPAPAGAPPRAPSPAPDGSPAGSAPAGAAAQWYRRAALLGRPEAQRRLAALLESGAGVAKDPVEARAWLEIASRGGDEEAKALLASREKTPAAVAARIEALEKEITPAPAGEGREIPRLVERALATASRGTADGMRLPGIAQALAAVSGKTAPSERHAETAPTQHRADAAALPKGEPNADAVCEIQRLLAIAHYDPGAATGVLNERTRAAIRRYQRTMGLPDDGLATPALLERLRKDASPLRPPGR